MPCPRRFLALAVALALALPLLAAESAPRTRVLLPGAADPAPQVRVQAESPDGLRLEVSVPNLTIEHAEVGGESFGSLSLPDGGHLGAVGEPALPTLTRLVALPPGVGASARLTGREMVDLGTLRPAPVQPVRAGASDGESARFDAAAWAAAPARDPLVQVGEPAILAGVRVVPVTISPVAFDPASGRAAVARRLEVEVAFTGRDGRNDPAGPARPLPASFAQLVDREVLGRDADAASAPGTYLLVCPDDPAVLAAVEDLARWRRRQGHAVEVVTTAETGTSNVAIRGWLQDRYATSDPPLEFVTLVGDADGAVSIPAWRENESGYGGEGDHAYARLDGDDVLADVHLGRLSVSSVAELQTVVAKIVAYESDPDRSDTDWFTTAGLTGDPASSGYSTIWVNQFVKEQLLELGYTRVDTIWSGNFLAQMMDTINQGETLFTYRGYWHMSGMSSNHIMSLGNGGQLPFAVILTCDTGSFWSEDNCRSEAFLRAPGGGGIAAIGTATIGTHTRYNNCMFLGITNGVLVGDDHRVGPALTAGKLNLYANYWVNEPHNVRIWSVWNNLMGDPATEIFTGVPQLLDVSYPAVVSTGANALPVTVTSGGAPVAGARVAVVQAGAVRQHAVTGPDGEVVLSLAGAQAGEVLVTVTGTNLHPHLGQTEVGAVDQALDPGAVTLDDTAGDGDGLAEPGEALDVTVALHNPGQQDLAGVTATLTGAPEWVTLTDPQADYGTVPAGGEASGEFQVSLTAAAPGGGQAHLRLDATGGGQTWTSLVDLPVHGPRAAAAAPVFGGTGGDLDPGESGPLTVALTNVGDAATAAVTGTLSCSSEWVEVTDAEGAWSPGAPGASLAQDDPFAVSVAATCYPGHLTTLELDLTFAAGGTQRLSLPVVIGEAGPGDPTGPDAHGYYAFDDQDAGELAPTYDWVEISTIGTNTGISDDSRHDDETRRFDLPFPFTYYGETHERVSICSNGWLAFGDTDLKLYRNWSLPADGSPDAMICAFWNDLAGGEVYTWHDTAGGRFVIQWDGFGAYDHGYEGDCTFQVILLDPAQHPTDTGDGVILLQYQGVTYADDETTRFTTGIQDHTRTVGLTYAYGGNYAGGAATVTAGRAIALRPVVPQATGTLEGAITNRDAGGAPVADALVTILGQGRQLASGPDGHYGGAVAVGTWDVAVSHPSFAPDTVYAVPVTEDQVTVRDFSLRDTAGPAFAEVTQLPDTEDTAGPYTVEALLFDHTGLATQHLHYTVSTDGLPRTVPLVLADPVSGRYLASIPGQPEGTRVQYWLTATDVLGNGSAAPAGAPWPTHGFMVATVTEVAADACEAPGDWQVDPTGGDDASTGIWEHGDPIGTFEDGDPVQPEDDHTPAPGVNCWFTGQHAAGQSSGYNDVDGGTTTLVTPVYDLSGLGTVEVEYWRWFSNDEGYSPGEDPWRVDLSNDGGTTWTAVENTLASEESWQPVSVTVNDLFPTPDRLRLRFRARDTGGGSLVEAAVDDLSILASTVVADLAPPTVAVIAPAAGAQYASGQTLTVTWEAADDVGVVDARVWLSLDGGDTYDRLLAAGPLTGQASWTVDVPAAEEPYDARVEVRVRDGQERLATAASGLFTILGGTSTDAPRPRTLVLAQNHPNPFNPRTSIAYALPRAGEVALRVYDIQGKLVRTLVDGPRPAGRHVAVWQGRDDQGSEVASGLYFARLSTPDGDQVRKMTLLK